MSDNTSQKPKGSLNYMAGFFILTLAFSTVIGCESKSTNDAKGTSATDVSATLKSVEYYKSAQELDEDEKEAVSLLVFRAYVEILRLDERIVHSTFRRGKAFGLLGPPYKKLDQPIESFLVNVPTDLSERQIRETMAAGISKIVVEVTGRHRKRKSFRITDYEIRYFPPGFGSPTPSSISMTPVKVSVRELQ